MIIFSQSLEGYNLKYIRQFLLILLISFLGETCRYLLPFSVPASIYGLIILFLSLWMGIVKLEQIKETSKFLIDIMPLMFIPAAVGLMDSWGILSNILIEVLLITVISTVLVMGIGGRVTQFIIRWEARHERDVK